MKLEDKKEFLQGGSLYDIDNLVIYLNNILPHYNYSIPAIEKAAGLSKDILGARIRNSNKYKKVQPNKKKGIEGLIIKLDTAAPAASVVPAAPIANKTIKSTNNTNNTQTPSKAAVAAANDTVTIKEFTALKSEVAALKTIIEGLAAAPAANAALIIEPRNEDATSKTYRFYPSSLEKLESFCKLFPQYKKYEIISHIIDNYIDNFAAK